MSGALSGQAMGGAAMGGAAMSGRALGEPDVVAPVDPLAELSDDFEAAGSLTDRGWTIYNVGTISTQTVSGGELHLQTTTGGSGGAWWYSQPSGPTLTEDGALIYKLVTGNFDVRARFRVRNAAGTASPSAAALEWRFAGLQVQDPAGLAGGTNFNYVHIGLGSDPTGGARQNAIEWKVTDDDGGTSNRSTFASDAGTAPLDYDLRIVRDDQTFSLYYRRTDSGETLASDVGWSLISIGAIVKDENTPARTGGATPVAFPEELAVGIMPPYAGPQVTVDLQCWVEEIQFSTP